MLNINHFEEWLRIVCFQKPTKEAYDLARSAWVYAISFKDKDITTIICLSCEHCVLEKDNSLSCLKDFTITENKRVCAGRE